MATSVETSVVQRVRRIQVITVAWMALEAAVSLAAAWISRSPALLAFGGDSAIELLSAVIVLWRFRAGAEMSERLAARVTGNLLFILAAFVLITSAMTLLGYGEPQPSYLGIAILAVAAILMPVLAREKRLLSASTGSAALRADAAESAVCGYMSVIALFGLILNSGWHIRWADPVAALVIIPLIVREGWMARQGEACRCVHS
jgi:divalent metal cation (Fe/Co/Zn/Cd) transporter